eukprot:4429282-Pleurochrysis_carterae.AAC.1
MGREQEAEEGREKMEAKRREGEEGWLSVARLMRSCVAPFETLEFVYPNPTSGTSGTCPQLIGNDLNPDEKYLRAFLPLVLGSVDALTYHNYAAKGGDISHAEFMSADYLDQGPAKAKGVVQAIHNHPHPNGLCPNPCS